MVRNPLVFSLGSLGLIAALAIPRGASAEWLVGSTMAITVDDSPLGTNFTQNVTLGNGATTLDHGELTLTQTLIPAGGGAEWLILDYQATGSGLIGGNANINWEYEATAQTAGSTDFDAWFFNWTVNGALVNSINHNGPWSGPIEPDPVNPSLGDVFSYKFSPPLMGTSWNLFAQIYPYSYDGDSGINVSTANGFVFGALISNAVPEPSSLALGVLASVSVAIGTWRGRRDRSRRNPALRS